MVETGHSGSVCTAEDQFHMPITFYATSDVENADLRLRAQHSTAQVTAQDIFAFLAQSFSGLSYIVDRLVL